MKKKLGRGVLYNEDCLKTLNRFEDESIDLVVTSPPYDDLREYNNSSSWSWESFTAIADALLQKLKKGGVIVWIVNDAYINGFRSLTSFRQALYFQEIGLGMHDAMIWEKDTFNFPFPNRYHQCYEYMFILSKGKPKTFNPIKDKKTNSRDRKLSTYREKDGSIKRVNRILKVEDYGKRFNIWTCPGVKSNKERFGHPAPFPLELVRDHILSWSNENDLVYDPFSGSGTTCYAAQYLNRNWVGSEIDSTYFEIAVNRIQTLTRTKSLFRKSKNE